MLTRARGAPERDAHCLDCPWVAGVPRHVARDAARHTRETGHQTVITETTRTWITRR